MLTPDTHITRVRAQAHAHVHAHAGTHLIPHIGFAENWEMESFP